MTKSKKQYAQDDWSSQPVGRPKTINDDYLARLKELVSHSPKQYGYPFERWTAQWLRKHLLQETGVAISDRHINRLLKQMGLSTRARIHLKRFRITINDLNSSQS
ncbi:helix-turn-helix domain-containing protein [Leptolyngbya sp. AN03gr2]|uniref:helix-turn-helix domain-containing protein n=1 Tax=unclassified Leptolyngbya TaxID=2650499 RepID=UPI003D31D64A